MLAGAGDRACALAGTRPLDATKACALAETRPLDATKACAYPRLAGIRGCPGDSTLAATLGLDAWRYQREEPQAARTTAVAGGNHLQCQAIGWQLVEL